MKKIFLSALIALCSVCAFGQSTFSKEGKTYTSVKTAKEKAPEKETGFTWKDSKGKEYTMYINSVGRCYVNKVSAKTGKTYRYYLPEEISKDVCKTMGLEYTYVPKTRTTAE